MADVGAWAVDGATDVGAYQAAGAVGPTLDASITYPTGAMPKDTAAYRQFITDSGITQIGSIQDDWRAALFSALTAPNRASVHDYSIDDVFLEYWEQENGPI